MNSRIFHLIKKEFIQAIRDPRMLFIILVAPIIQLVILGYVATTEVKNISLAIYDQDRSFYSEKLIDKFKGSPYFKIKHYVFSPKETQRLIDSGMAKIALRIENGFGKDIQHSNLAPVQVIFDGSDSNSAIVSSGYVSSIMEGFSGEVVKERLYSKGIDIESFGSLQNKTRVWFNEELKSSNYVVPGIVAMLLLIDTMILAALAIVKEKEYGTLEQLIVTPIKPYELLVGKMVPYVIITYIEIILSILVAVFWFKVPFRGSFVLLLLLLMIFLLPTLGIGLFISLISRTQYQAFLTAFLVMFPMIMLSGFIYPIQNMPKVIQLFTYLLPLRYFLEIVRGIFLKGIGLKYLWKEVWPLLILGSSIFILSVSMFRKKLS